MPLFCKNNEFNEGCNYSALKVVHILLLIPALLLMLFSRNNEHFTTNHFLIIRAGNRPIFGSNRSSGYHSVCVSVLLLFMSVSETVIVKTERSFAGS